MEVGEIMTLTDVDKQAIHSFLSLAFYNGYEDDVKDILKALKTAFYSDDKYKSIMRPDWKKYKNYKVDEFGGIFWSWLVIQYGDYGTSPRFGWLYRQEAREIADFIEESLQDNE